jgi:hypothetical protein
VSRESIAHSLITQLLPRPRSHGYDGASRLTSVNGIGYSYIAVGNTIKKSNIATGEYWTYSWNDANQLTVAADYQSNGTLIQSVTFKYDQHLGGSE